MKVYFNNRFIILSGIEMSPVYHKHHAIQLCTNLTIKTVLMCEDHEHKGDIIIVDSDKTHTIQSNNNTLIILINPETYEGYKIRGLLKEKDCLTLNQTSTSVKSLIYSILKGDVALDKINILYTDLITEIVGKDLTLEQELDRRIENVISNIKPNELDNISSKDLASKVFLSESRFQHLFKESIGISVTRYLLWVKTITAIKLAISGKNLTDSAIEAGFSDSPHFSKTVKSTFGITPKSIISSYMAHKTHR